MSITALVRYDSMCRAIAAAYEVDEVVKDIRDKALRHAIETYARQAKEHAEAERQACEIKLRAERRGWAAAGRAREGEGHSLGRRREMAGVEAAW